jgi:hypothetical protein
LWRIAIERRSAGIGAALPITHRRGYGRDAALTSDELLRRAATAPLFRLAGTLSHRFAGQQTVQQRDRRRALADR